MKLLSDIDVFEKRVLVRLDLDVPLRGGVIIDFTRVEESVPTLSHLIKNHAKVIILGHLGRPNGRFVSALTTEQLAEPLSKLLFRTVTHFSIAIGTEVTQAVNEMKPGEVFLLENLRFYPGEEGNDPNFAKALSDLGNIYVNDAFADCHRQHASIVNLPKHLPSAAGMRLSAEVTRLSALVNQPKQPYILVVGGAKSDTKIAAIEKLAKKADKVLVGGKLPKDIGEHVFNLSGDNIIIGKTNEHGADLASDTIEEFKTIISQAGTIVWNGPMGVFEEPAYEFGTKEIATAIVNSRAETIVGGGDTIAAANKFGLLNKFSWVSLGGGSMLEYLANGNLPGLQSLE